MWVAGDHVERPKGINMYEERCDGVGEVGKWQETTGRTELGKCVREF